jgi:hypothetical protein
VTKTPQAQPEGELPCPTPPFDTFDTAQPRHVLPETGIPHPRYGHDEFSPIRLPQPTIIQHNLRKGIEGSMPREFTDMQQSGHRVAVGVGGGVMQ